MDRLAWASDRMLDAVVLVLAAWTAIYHVCLVLGLGVVWAAVVMIAVLWPCLRLVGGERAADVGDARVVAVLPLRAIAAVVSLGVAGALLFVFTDVPWVLNWLPLGAAAVAAVVLTWRRSERSERLERSWAEAPVAIAWAIGLAVLSLYLARSDGDDTHYVHVASWVAANHEFPLRDVLFTDQQLPAIFFPPLSSWEALVGTVAAATRLAAPDLVYYVVPPVGSVLAVMATWRLLRHWAVPMVAVALSVAMVFLLWDAVRHRTLGNLFVGRMWHGKVLFLTVLVPVLFVLLGQYAERPTRQALIRLGAAGTAGVGLTITGVFLVPVIAAGCMAPLALRAPRRAAIGFAATAAYPVGAALVSVLVGARNAEDYEGEDMAPRWLLELALSNDAIATVALTAILAGPMLIRRARATEMTASTALLVVCLFAPTVPLLILEATGLGRVLRRLTWAVPIGALLGVVAVAAAAPIRQPLLRLAPAALLCAAFVASGQPVWSTYQGTSSRPMWKRWPGTVRASEQILRVARPGDVILAPDPVSDTLLVMSGRVTVVSPRPFYTIGLIGVPGAQVRERLTLLAFANEGLGRLEANEPWMRKLPTRTVEPPAVVRALRAVKADLACVASHPPDAGTLLRSTGYRKATTTETLVCFRAPEA